MPRKKPIFTTCSHRFGCMTWYFVVAFLSLFVANAAFGANTAGGSDVENNVGGSGGQSDTPNTGQDSEEAEKNLKAAQEKYDAAKAREQSFANRALTSVSTAATGLGGMQFAEGIAEQKADEEAEKDMREYISTMKCEYGKGQQVDLGNQDVTLPGGNDLLGLYTEYKQTAERLKQTKAALGLRAGIESEVLYDKAQTGLYQYSHTGKTGGGETSLFRALTDESSDDAAAWATQKDISAQKRKAGAIAVAGGIATGIVGNLLINGLGNDDDDDTDLSDLGDIDIDAINRCPDGQTRDANGICVCINGQDVSNGCRDSESRDSQEEKPEARPYDNSQIDSLPQRKVEPKLESDDLEKLLNYTGDSRLFKSGEYTLDETQTMGLKEYATNLVEVLGQDYYKDTVLCVTVTGYTDRVPVDAKKHKGEYKNNEELSKLRADAVAKFFDEKTRPVASHIRNPMVVNGVGPKECTSAAGFKQDDERCRKVEIKLEKCAN